MVTPAMLALKFAQPARATDATWNVDFNGTWDTNGNWTGGVFPNAIGDTATFGGVILNNTTITLSSGKTVGNITFDAPKTYTLTPAGSAITLDVASGNAGLTLISGSHII